MDIIGDLIKWIRTYCEDYRRNRTIYQIWDYNINEWKTRENQHIYPGDIISIEKDMVIPVDILLLDQFSKDFCKVSLANLNGESNLITVDKLCSKCSVDDYRMARLKIENNNQNSIFDIDGYITLRNGERLNWTSNTLLVNGSKLASDGCIGIVVACGRDLKLANSKSDNSSMFKINSAMEKISNFMMNTTVYILVMIVLFLSIYKSYYYYLENQNIILTFYFIVLNMIQNWIVLNGLIPFSLKILLSVIRQFQTRKLSNILKINFYSPYLIDQLSQIDYVLSDKTGTITKNNLELMRLVDSNGQIYYLDKNNTYIPKNIIRAVGLSIGYNDGDYYTPEDKTIHARYLYLNCQIEYCKNDIKLNMYGDSEQYKRVDIPGLQFTTLRPISSNIFKNTKTGGFFIYTKASISRLRDILVENDKEKLDIADGRLSSLDPSLRTLAIGYREISKEEFNSFCELTEIERNLYVQRFECGLNFVGILGIQDTLIDNIDQSIDWLLDNNISVGILTGDRKLTALAIARQAGLIKDDTKIVILDDLDTLRSNYLSKSIYSKTKTLYVFNNQFLINILTSLDTRSILMDLLRTKPLLLGYSLTPSGKKIMVDLLESINIKTLSIGDGYNDIPMLKSANIGISLSEGIQSVSDCRANSFHDLKGIFSYGYQFSLRNQVISLFTMYKSCSLGFILFWYLLLNDGNDRPLFTFLIYQGFHLLWCIIHPLDYAINVEVSDRLVGGVRNILNNRSMFFWILVSAFHSSLLAYLLRERLFDRSLITYSIIYQVNNMLFVFDLTFRSLFYQFINIVFFGLYVAFFDVGFKPFLDNYLANILNIVIYYLVVFVDHQTIAFYYRYFILKRVDNQDINRKLD
jgi:phospholipid-transporting ATPase